MFQEIVKLGQVLVGPEPGVKLLLFFLCGLAAWAYWKEKKRNEEVSKERLKEAKEDTKAMADALNEAKTTVESFKASNDALRVAFETLTRSIGKDKGN
jgi:cbb3-type cytochrome oxidase subunit 3